MSTEQLSQKSGTRLRVLVESLEQDVAKNAKGQQPLPV